MVLASGAPEQIPKARQRQVANEVIGTFMRLLVKNSA
jgi:hypothetical protein